MTLTFRPFKDSDAETVFKIRTAAFVTQFFETLGAEAVAAGINTYLPNDFLKMSKSMVFCIAEESEEPLAFYTIKRNDKETAELLFIYIESHHLGRGIGTQLIRHSEDWIKKNWPETKTYMLTSPVPKNNSDFYRKMGFHDVGPVVMPYPDVTVHGLEMAKSL